jgi:antitoxin HicB
MRYAYPGRLKTYPGEVVVTFRGLPEAVAGGATREEALANAAGVLRAALAFRLKDDKPIPIPSAARRGEVLVPVSPLLAAKVALTIAVRDSGLSSRELADRLTTDEREVHRILDPDHATRIERIADAMQLLGRRLVLTDEAA